MAIKDDIAEALADIPGMLETEVWADTFRLERDTDNPDDAGGGSSVPAIVAAGPCRLRTRQLQATEQAIADRRGYQQPAVVDLPVTLTISTSDRLIVNGVLFEIGGVAPLSAWDVKRSVVVQAVG